MRAISGRLTRPEVRDDRQRLERRLREAALDRPLEQPPARLGGLARGAQRPAAGDVLEHDPAAALAKALADEPERRLDPLASSSAAAASSSTASGRDATTSSASTVTRQAVERAGGDQAERAVHSSLLLHGPRRPADPDRGERRRLLDARPRPTSAAPAARATRPPARCARARPAPRRSRTAGGGAGRRGNAPGTRPGGNRARDVPARPPAARRQRAHRGRQPLRLARARAGARAAARAAPGRAGRSGRPPLEPLREPGRSLLRTAVLGEPAGQLLGGLLGLELVELGRLVREQPARLQLQQRGDEHEELAAGLEVEPPRSGEPLAERERRSRPRPPRPAPAPRCSTSASSRSNGPSKESRSSSSSRASHAPEDANEGAGRGPWGSPSGRRPACGAGSCGAELAAARPRPARGSAPRRGSLLVRGGTATR